MKKSFDRFLDIETNMKLSSLISKSHQSFASVFLAFSLFGFLFPHQTKEVKPNHQVNMRTSEQPANSRAATLVNHIIKGSGFAINGT